MPAQLPLHPPGQPHKRNMGTDAVLVEGHGRPAAAAAAVATDNEKRAAPEAAPDDKARRWRRKEKPSSSSRASIEDSFQRIGMRSSHTNPLFPPMPRYGPPSLLRSLQNATLRASSFFLSLSFLSGVLLGSLVTSIPGALRRVGCYLTLRDADAGRPFLAEERRRKQLRREEERGWKRRRREKSSSVEDPDGAGVGDATYTPTAGGPDPLVPDVAHYARRVGLDVETFAVQTEDGFILDLWHVYDPREHTPKPADQRQHRGPGLLFDETTAAQRMAMQEQMLREAVPQQPAKTPKYPVLLIHGLLQSAGAYCVGDDASLAFYLCKAGYDVWLGNNRCGFRPRHATLATSDPRMWCWNIRHMGVFDLPALASRVLRETRYAQLALVCHSQGTTEALVALAKEQRPTLGRALSVFCALAPAAYAGPLISKAYFRFLRLLSPALFRLLFGIHAFIPLMMFMHRRMPGRLYGWLGYRVFSFLFEWSDARWDRGLRNRMFQFAPVYVSAESMRWWLGREGFARHKCILSTKEAWRAEEAAEEAAAASAAAETSTAAETEAEEEAACPSSHRTQHHHHHAPGSTAWYDEQAPPFALWVCGRDELVDGWRLLKRLLPAPVFAVLRHGHGNRSVASGRLRSTREPHVRVVHAKVLPEYEHLDVIWAMDAVDLVFSEVRDVVWKTCPVRSGCRVPSGCENVPIWEDETGENDDNDEDDEDDLDETMRGNSTSRETEIPLA